MSEDIERKERLIALFDALEPQKITNNVLIPQFSFNIDALRFSLEILSNPGEIINAAEGGIVVGEGDNAEVISHLPIRVNSYKAVLKVKDTMSNLVIETYDELGDGFPNINWVNPEGKPVPYSPLFELYRRTTNKLDTYEKKMRELTAQDKVARGRSKLDEILKQHNI